MPRLLKFICNRKLNQKRFLKDQKIIKIINKHTRAPDGAQNAGAHLGRTQKERLTTCVRRSSQEALESGAAASSLPAIMLSGPRVFNGENGRNQLRVIH